MKLKFDYNREKDIWCLLNKGKSSNNSQSPTKVYEQLVATSGENLTNEATSAFIEKYISENNIDLQEYIERYQKDWDEVKEEYTKRAEAIFQVKLPEDVTAYLTINNRCPYNIEENYFFVSVSATSVRRTVMHELFHFYTWYAFGKKLINQGVSKEKYNDIKESLTVILNTDFSDLLNGAIDNGYSQHQDMRTEIARLWSQNKDMNKVIEALATDRELFKGTGEYYAKYRIGYTSEFFKHIVNYFNLDGKGRLLDLGCGTGQLAIPLAKYFEEVIGIDPEKEMVDEAEKQSSKAGIKNIHWVQGKAEEISSKLGVFRLITIGAAFHWMDQVDVLKKVYSLTENDGGLVIVYDSAGSWATKDDRPLEWQQKVRSILRKYLGEKRRAGNSFYKKPEGDFDDLVEESPFGKQETWTQEYTRSWDTESIIGFLYSTSFASKRLFGDKLSEFENELRSELMKTEPSGKFVEQAVIEAIITRKNG